MARKLCIFTHPVSRESLGGLHELLIWGGQHPTVTVVQAADVVVIHPLWSGPDVVPQRANPPHVPQPVQHRVACNITTRVPQTLQQRVSCNITPHVPQPLQQRVACNITPHVP